MKFTLKKLDLEKSFGNLSKASQLKSEALVVASHQLADSKKKKLSGLVASFDELLGGVINDLVNDENFKFKTGETVSLRLSGSERAAFALGPIKKLILVGLGEEKDFDKKAERKVAASILRKAKSEKVSSLAVNSFGDIALLVETLGLVNYEFTKYKSDDDKDDKKQLTQVTVLSSSVTAKEKDAIAKSEVIIASVNKARDLVWEPACVVNPTYLAKEAKKIKGTNFTVKVMEKAQCEKLGMGAYLAVAQAGGQPPKFIEMTYKPKGKIKKHIAIVGKGVTFDSGGLSLKPSKAMEMMKEDMSGSAATIGLMNAIVKLQPANIQVTGIIAATENMPSASAYKPGDVITAMNGKTIEVNNTDAEGRLTLADAVAYVSKKNPDEIIDIATLTGACMVALGNTCAGIMTNNQDLLDRVKAVADKQGENMWQLPLYDEYKEKLKSTIADLINAGSGGQAGAQNGGLFIQEFVGKQTKGDKAIPWLHIDIAGPCWLDDASDWSPKGASGIPVRTLLNYILSI
ncbi:MAG: leucyl aminopeptidase [Candidatus Caenarcaniphilales bacterium]|nr:leucyl aminopeptidase [Candidatus Caenarcaniphilales bacterium]